MYPPVFHPVPWDVFHLRARRWDVFRDDKAGSLTFPDSGMAELRVRSADGKPPMINLRQIVLERE